MRNGHQVKERAMKPGLAGAQRVALVGLLASASLPGQAEVVFPVPRPEPVVGEIGVEARVDPLTGVEMAKSTLEIVSVRDETIIVRNAANGRIVFSRDWNHCARARGQPAVPCQGNLRFPLVLGARHSFNGVLTNDGGVRDGTCEVENVETVKVPAGEFEAVKVVCSGFITPKRVDDISSYQDTVWFAPSIGRVIRFDWKNKPRYPHISQTFGRWVLVSLQRPGS
jgi:hypothetical protein